MVQLMRSGTPTAEPEACRDKAPVKLEIVEDYLEEEHGPVNKRSKLSPNLQQWSSDGNAFPIPPAQYNPLDEPSPLGLKLRKSPSLLDLIQMRLSQSQSGSPAAQAESLNSGVKKESKAVAATDKLKASNFPASILRIGHWEYKSRYEGDLVAKCYFAKHKLVWEVLEGGLKSKIEIQWSDIMGLKANCPDNGPGTLNVVLARQPLFFRETNPQPRKHTLWQTTSDFTDGQASIHRQHFLQCPQGLLNKHFEKLVQCDMRLNCLSRQPEIILDSPYFESRSSVFEDPSEPKGHDYGQGETGKGSTSSGFQNIASPVAAHSSSLEIEKGDSAAITSENMSREAPSPSSDSCAIEGSGVCEAVDSKGPRNWDQIKVPGLHPSMSMSDLMNHIGHRLSEHMTSENPSSENRPDCQEMLEDIAQYLLSDTQFTTASDEKSLMSRVNSLCCLLQKDNTTGTSSQANGENYDGSDDGKDVQLNRSHGFEFNITGKDDVKAFEGETKEVSSSRQAPGMSRKDSFSELLLHLPRIASLPKFLFNISEEDGERQAR
ncbi:Pre-rRNA-processing protein IPI3 [Gossypium australe]|uniref:Pre-rRNA-processing protein IPI3 n=1 Tax=Gossypium australe TaxID=47621 RepID=A0A5B6VMV3_9ROSI|nr:Pre-rRNA-processing protein IPI3 [Gossypium australe]